MYHVWSFFIRKTRFSYLLIVTLVIFGISALFSMPRESNPEVSIPIGIVSTALPGASALDVETLITNKIEEKLKNNLDDVKNLTSSSREGISSIVVEFDASANLDKSIQELKDEVDAAAPDLPDEATDPFVFQVDFANDPILIFAVSGDLPPSEFQRLAKDIEREIKAVKDVSDVSIDGNREREVQVIVNKEALSTFGLNLVDIVSGISQTNSTLPAGSISVNEIEYNVQFEGDIDDPREIADIAILSVGGKPVYVRDVAIVIDGFEEQTTISRISIDGKPSKSSLSFNVFKQTGRGDITKITSAVQERLVELQQPGYMLDGLETLVIFDTGEFLLEDLTTLTRSGMYTIMLVMLILFITLGWREALIAGSAIPLSFLIAFIGLNATGNSLNFISLFSLILAVGVLVDSAIVIVEGINTRMKRWVDKREAALSTIKEFNIPITSGTMTTVAVFAPLFFVSGIVGEFIKGIPYTIIFLLLASLLVALGLVPLISSVFMRRRMTSTLEKKQTRYAKKLRDWYAVELKSFLESRRKKLLFVSSLFVLFIIAVSLPITGIVKTIFFDQGDADFAVVEVELPQGTVLSRTDLETRKVEEILLTEPDIDAFSLTVGAGSPFGSQSSGSKFANAFLLLKDTDDRDRTSLDIIDSLREKFALITTSQVRANQPADGPPVGTPVVIKFLGDDLQELNSLAENASELLASIPGTSDIVTSTKNDGTQFVLEIDKAKATELGLNSSLVSQTLRAAIHGIEATTINNIEEDIDVVVKLNLNTNYRDPHDTNRTTVDAIRQIEIQSSYGAVLLGSILTTSIAQNSTTIAHEDARRVSIVESELTSTGNVREIIEEFKDRIDEINIPPSVTVVYGGENEETDQSFKDMGVAFIVGVILMFFILVLQFNSIRYAGYIIMVIFLSLIGIFFGLLITNQPLSFPSLMGLIALSGIVVNNAIIMIDAINKLRLRNPERAVQAMVIEGAASRLRPVLLTTITTVIGLFPLTFASALWAPLAWSIIFGLSFTVVVTLFFIPMLYNRKPGSLEALRSAQSAETLSDIAAASTQTLPAK